MKYEKLTMGKNKHHPVMLSSIHIVNAYRSMLPASMCCVTSILDTSRISEALERDTRIDKG